MDHKLPEYDTAIDLLIVVSQWLPRQNTGKSDSLTDHFTNIETHTCTHTYFLMFQQLGGNGSTVNLMPINWEFLQLQFDTKQSSVLRKKISKKKRTRIRLPSLRGHGKQSKELGKKPSVLFVNFMQTGVWSGYPLFAYSYRTFYKNEKMLPNTP